MNKKLDIKIIAIIIAVSATLGVFHNALRVERVPLIYTPKPEVWESDSALFINDSTKNNRIPHSNSVTDTTPPSKNSTVKQEAVQTGPKTITLKQAYRLFKNRSAIFIDARDKWEFSDGHIKGALNIAQYSFDKNNTVLKKIGKNKTMVVYCSESDCDMSEKLAGQLFEIGYTRVYIFKEGYEGWVSSGFDVETGAIE